MPLELPCDQCGEVFLTVPTRQRHIRIKHRNTPVSQESHPSPPSTPPPAAAPITTTITTTPTPTATKKTAAQKSTPAASPSTTTNTTNTSNTLKTTADATKKTAAQKPNPTTKTTPIASKKPSPPAKKPTHEEEMKSRLVKAHKFADELAEYIPSREDFIRELMTTDPHDPGFCLFIPEGADDVSDVQGYYRDFSQVTPLTDASFRKSVKLLAKNPFTKPNPMTTNLLDFEMHLESVCDSLISKKAVSMPMPLRYWSYSLSEMMRRTMVFMALQDAAALDKRIKYTEEMANCDYDGMLVVFESDFASKRAEQNQLAAALTTLGLIKPGQRPEDVSVETVKQFSNMTLVQVLESVSGMMESQRKQMRTPTPANASNPAASKPAAAKPATPTPTASKPATPKPAASTPTVAKPTGAKAATPKPSAKPTPAPKPPTTTGNVRQKECSPDCLCENELMTRSVQCFHDNPFTLPDPLSRNLASFIHYLENTCEGMLSKQSQFMLGADWRQSVLTPIQQAQLCFSCVMGAGGMRGFEWDIGIEDEDFGSRMTRVCKGLGIDTPEKMRALKLM